MRQATREAHGRFELIRGQAVLLRFICEFDLEKDARLELLLGGDAIQAQQQALGVYRVQHRGVLHDPPGLVALDVPLTLLNC